MGRDKSNVRAQRGWFHKLRWLHVKVDVKGDDDYVRSKNGKVHLLLLPETHSISYQSLQPGSTVNYASLLRGDQAESIGAGVPTYLKEKF